MKSITIVEKSLKSTQIPKLKTRISSTMIDMLVVLLLMVVASRILEGLQIESGEVRKIVFILVWLYEPLMISIDRTLGQRIMGIRVELLSPKQASQQLSPLRSLLRYFFKLSLGFISLFTIHSNKNGQAIHDMAAGSVMVKTPTSLPFRSVQ